MLLLLTGSPDSTSDRIIAIMGNDIFRLNYDLWAEYQIAFTPDGWQISNPSGHKISSETVSRVMLWKPFDYFLTIDKLVSSEIKYVFRELYGWCVNRGMLRGTPFYFHQKNGKINILSIAQKYFEIPRTLVTFGLSGIEYLQTQLVVAKSLSSAVSEENRGLMTTMVNSDQLDPLYPWYLQTKIESDWDITVFLCGDKLFPFKRSRANLIGVDWRAEQPTDSRAPKSWFPFVLDMEDSQKLFALSKEMKVDWGRYDFMLCSETNNLVFLEYNANGQWTFLDVHNEYGLLDQVVHYLTS
jgi:hypothetical protein